VTAVPRRTISALILALSALLGSCTADDTLFGVAEQDAPLPRLAGETVDGGELDTETYAEGSILVINVWADWCEPCELEQPQLVRLADRYEDEGVRFLGINYQDDRDAAKGWIERFEVPYPSLFDPYGRTAAELGYPGLPGTYVVDREGTIRWVVYGETDERELAGLIDDVLA
jgi:DsbE subfamily thiol:disulfide oxidoreductase